MLFIGCDQFVLKNDKKIEVYDDELIDKIHNATNKIEIDYNHLPINIISEIENYYSAQIFISQLSVMDLGYELTHTGIDANESSFKKIYFDATGKKLISKRDYNKGNKECFKLVLPVTYVMPDESYISVLKNDDWRVLKNWYDDNPNLKERPILKFPIDIIYKDGNIITINNDDELIEAKSNCIDCIELVYPVTFILPDGTTMVVEKNNKEGWKELKDWYNKNTYMKFDWNLQYPVEVQLEDGTIININSLSELKQVKQNCK